MTTKYTCAQIGVVDFVPNGSFEDMAKPDDQLGQYDARYGKYSLFWRQFHRYTDQYETGTLPIWTDQRWDQGDVMYPPVACSSSDLFSQHLQDCFSPPPIIV